MELFPLQNLLDKIQGCTFANLDTITEPSPGIQKVTRGERVILFTNKKVSGYENMVRRRLEEAGKNPDNFVLGDLPWGSRVPNSPLIENKGKFYLQCIRLKEGRSRFFIGDREIQNPRGLMLKKRRTNQGLLEGEEVEVACYKLENIQKIALMDETLTVNDEGVMPALGA
jgi:hypothetical protein